MKELIFDPAEALAAEGIPMPQPVEVAVEDLNDRAKMKDALIDAGLHPETVISRLSEAFSPVEAINPKELAGSKKPAVWSVFPRWVSLLVGRVMETGAAKYGAFNYRETPIAASTYEDAMERHAQLWFDGEDTDSESGVSHLAHVIACATLLLDAQATGQLVDNRQKTGLVRRKLDELEQLRKTLPFPTSK